MKLTDRNKEYCRLRACNIKPRDAYNGAGYSMSTGRIKQRLAELESDPAIIKLIQELREVRAATGETDQRSLLRHKAEKVHRQVEAPLKKRKMGKEEIAQELTDLHAMAVSEGDLATARQVLVDLGKDLGMFTPVQKIRFETVDDLSLEDTEALIQRLMAAKQSEQVVPNEEDERTAAVVQ